MHTRARVRVRTVVRQHTDGDKINKYTSKQTNTVCFFDRVIEKYLLKFGNQFLKVYNENK